MTDPLLAHADELYALGLADFTPARDALAKRLRTEDRALSDQVKALRKPAMAAWVVNLLVRRDAEQVERVLGVGAALREAQSALDGAELRALTRQRRQLTAAVTTQARALAAEEGVRVTEPVAEQVEATLTAAMLDPGAAQAVRSGLLVSPLTATGVDAVDVAAAVAAPDALGFVAPPRAAVPPPPPQLHVVPDPEPEEPAGPSAGERARAQARREAQARLREAEALLRRAETAHRRAGKAVDKVRASVLQVHAEIDELRRQVAEREARAEALEEELAGAEEAQETTADDLETALAERDARRAELDPD